MQRNIAEVANETREVALFDFWGGQLPVTCERCDICTVTGEGTSFWNTVRHSFTINLVLAVFLREVPIRTYVMSNTTNQFVTSEGKRSISRNGQCTVMYCLCTVIAANKVHNFSTDKINTGKFYWIVAMKDKQAP